MAQTPQLPASYVEHVAAPAIAARLLTKNPKAIATAAAAGFSTRYYRGKSYHQKIDDIKIESLKRLGVHKSAT